MFGRETRGLPESLLAAAGRERLLTIPMAPAARSLNLATAAGIVLFEAMRQVRTCIHAPMTSLEFQRKRGVEKHWTLLRTSVTSV